MRFMALQKRKKKKEKERKKNHQRITRNNILSELGTNPLTHIHHLFLNSDFPLTTLENARPHIKTCSSIHTVFFYKKKM